MQDPEEGPRTTTNALDKAIFPEVEDTHADSHAMQSGPWGSLRVEAPPPALLPSGLTLADFWTRSLAYLLDNLFFSCFSSFLATFSLVTVTALYGEGYSEIWRKDQNSILLLNALLLIFDGGLYAYFAASGWQASPGQRFCGVYVIRKSGQPISYGLALLRYFLSIFSAIPFGLGYFMAAWTKEKTTLHDLILDTRVVYGRVNGKIVNDKNKT